MIIIPSKSIINRPKLNIANDNSYENISYMKNNLDFTYKELGTYNLDIINIDGSNMSNANSNNVLWSSVLSETRNPYILKQNNINKNIKVYEWQNGISATKIFPITGGNWYNFVIKITIPKPDINFDYFKTEFGVWQDFRYLFPHLNNRTIVFERYIYSENAGIEEVPIVPVPKSKIFDKTATESDMLSSINVKPDLSEVISSGGGITPFISVRIDDSNIEFYINNGVVSGNISTDSLYAIYSPQTFKFYYKNIEKINSEEINPETKYSLPDNELLAEQTTYEDNSIYEQIESSIVSEYEYGKHSVDLTCLYMEYKDELGLTVYNGKDGNLISVGDIICPYYYNNEMNEVPIATYEDGTQMQFIVYKSNLLIDDNNLIKNEISAIELKQEEFNPALNYTGLDANGNMEGQLAFDGTIVAYGIGKPRIQITESTNSETGEVTQTESIFWDYSNGLNSEYLGVDVTQASEKPYSNLGIDNVVIPNSYNGKPITKILNQAFYSRYSDEASTFYYGASAIKTLTLGENVLELGEESCHWFDGELIFNSKIQTLQTYSLYRVFSGVFDLPMSIKFLGSRVFVDRLDKLNVYGNVTNINDKKGIYDGIPVVEFKTSVSEVVGSICNVSPCDMVFRHTNSDPLTLNIEAMKSAYETTIYTDNDYVKSYDWASKNYTVTFKSLSEYTGS